MNGSLACMTGKHHVLHEEGFTLLELLVTLAVALILLAVVVPTWRWLVLDARLASTADLLQTGYRMTRTEAIKSSSTAILQPATGSDWNSGWMVLNKIASGSEQVIWRSGSLPGGVTVAPDINNSVRVAGNGALKMSVNGKQSPTKFTIHSANSVMCLTLLISGQSYLTESGC